VPLGIAHSRHADIKEKGLGRFFHWGSGIIFSTSDNQNPITTGRTYAVEYAVSPSWWLPALLLTIGGLDNLYFT